MFNWAKDKSELLTWCKPIHLKPLHRYGKESKEPQLLSFPVLQGSACRGQEKVSTYYPVTDNLRTYMPAILVYTSPYKKIQTIRSIMEQLCISITNFRNLSAVPSRIHSPLSTKALSLVFFPYRNLAPQGGYYSYLKWWLFVFPRLLYLH